MLLISNLLIFGSLGIQFKSLNEIRFQMHLFIRSLFISDADALLDMFKLNVLAFVYQTNAVGCLDETH